jgi:NADPH:quinone reductase-like Zn-dependent oxidoreductase
MKVWEIAGQFGLENLRLTEAPEPVPGHGQVKLRMLAASINYRDLVVVEGNYGRAIRPPVVPLSDGVGEVVALGPGVSRLKLGDRVCPTFFPDWSCGQPHDSVMQLHRARGAAQNGTLCEALVVDERATVAVPDYLSHEEAATLPCAGVTAWNALTYGRPTLPGESVLVQGTGGVSVFALQFAAMMGARVIVTSSSDEKLDRARALGAGEVVNYRTTPEWHQEVRRFLPEGVDRIVEVGGADTVSRSIKCVRMGGVIAMIGVLSGARSAIDLPLVVMRFIRLEGITVGSTEHFEAMVKAMTHARLRPQVGAVLPFDQAPLAFEKIKAGGTFGKICITM